MLNSFPDLGQVIVDKTLYRWRQSAGLQISSDAGKTVDFYKFAAWVFDKRHAPQQEKKTAKSYDQLKEEARQRNAEASKSGRDIGELPQVANPERKAKALKDLKFFLSTYFPETFSLSWSRDHNILLTNLQKIIIEGGLQAVAMPRGNGKTQISIRSAIWAMLTGRRQLISMIGATEAMALDLLESVKTELETNNLLLADFPEVCYPIRSLEGITNRCRGQLYKNQRTRIVWDSDRISLPVMPDSPASGVKMTVAGITGSIRGLSFTQPGKGVIRPELVIVDDPQTNESARSPEQIKNRLKAIKRTILGLSAPNKKISVIIPCTVIEPDDVADQLLDHDKNPEWNGIRTKLLEQFPKNEDLWDEYNRQRIESYREYHDIRLATEFYRQNREVMDEGAVVSWPDRYEEGELSGIQHAMNLKFQDEAGFLAEYQNEPQPENNFEDGQITPELITGKLNGLDHTVVPLDSDMITSFVDVQGKMLYYVVIAWSDTFTGAVIDYGTYPDQKRRDFTLADARITLKHKHPGTSDEGAIYAGLESLTDDLFTRTWKREDGANMNIERLMIDANWGEMTNVVYQFCRQSQFAALLLPSHGRGITASMKPFSEYRRQPGDRIGHNWMIPNTRGKRVIRHVLYDTNYWKSFIRSRLFTAMGDCGCLSFWGRQSIRHMLIAEHCTCEYFTATAGRGRKVDEWKIKPARKDNHWFDCIVGAAVAANVSGVNLPGVTDEVAQRGGNRDLYRGGRSISNRPANRSPEPVIVGAEPPERRIERVEHPEQSRSWSQIQQSKRKNTWRR